MNLRAVRTGLVASALAVALLTPALAAEHPPFAPTRDVAVAYQVQIGTVQMGGVQMGAGAQAANSPQGGHNVRMSYSVANGLFRIDQQDQVATLPPGYMIVDPAAGRLTVVVEPMHSFMEMPFDGRAGAGLLLNGRMAFAQGGTDRVAGLACTIWDVTSGQTKARLCITADGVILRGEGNDPKGGEGRLQALSVSYGAQPARLFVPPPGFHRLALPGMTLPNMAIPGLGKPPG